MTVLLGAVLFFSGTARSGTLSWLPFITKSTLLKQMTTSLLHLCFHVYGAQFIAGFVCQEHFTFTQWISLSAIP